MGTIKMKIAKKDSIKALIRMMEPCVIAGDILPR
jgi:hypothetical protein